MSMTSAHAARISRTKFVRQGQLAVGVDVGGTWIRMRALVGGHLATRAAERRARTAEIDAFLREVWRRQRWRSTLIAALVVSSSGIWTPHECRRMARRLSAFAHHVRVIPDAQAAALGALGGQPGVLVLSGTGSIVVGHDGRGRWERAGGFGPLLGDEGSGFWLGREWLRATVAGDFEAVRALAHAPKPVSAIAALAPMVIARARRGDRCARRIVAAGQAQLAANAAAIARRLVLPTPVTMSWAGGVLADPWFRAGVIRAVARGGLRVRWITPRVTGVIAAARLAQELVASPAALRPRRTRTAR
ncbi:MAG: BadF/BadG/BcrA/BcrD ATPase family protein [Candidatus Rokuibacteriota bacterium]